MIGGIGMTEIIIILVIVLIIFGAGKLPEVGSALGRGIKNFKSAVTEPEEKKSVESEKEQKNHNESKD
ncbi:MAG: twin-arginine translocase TatA/TatE family subunit [Deltaproteobacteria bacterium]|nr:twin-arginine translocase TatA/TatE family subunit [Deltaproteobacteria bacterium]